MYLLWIHQMRPENVNKFLICSWNIYVIEFLTENLNSTEDINECGQVFFFFFWKSIVWFLKLI